MAFNGPDGRGFSGVSGKQAQVGALGRAERPARAGVTKRGEIGIGKSAGDRAEQVAGHGSGLLVKDRRYCIARSAGGGKYLSTGCANPGPGREFPVASPGR